MNAQLTKTKTALKVLLNALRNTASALPQHGCLEDNCQRQAFLNATHQLGVIISNLSVENILTRHGTIPPKGFDVCATALRELKKAEEQIHSTLSTFEELEFNSVNREAQILHLKIQASAHLRDEEDSLLSSCIARLESVDDVDIFASVTGYDFVVKSLDPIRFNTIEQKKLKLKNIPEHNLKNDQPTAH